MLILPVSDDRNGQINDPLNEDEEEEERRLERIGTIADGTYFGLLAVPYAVNGRSDRQQNAHDAKDYIEFISDGDQLPTWK